MTRTCSQLLASGSLSLTSGPWRIPYRIPLENLCVNEVMADEAFITSLSTSLNEKSKRKDDRLCHVRKDHDKLMDVVETFGSKVSIM